MPSSGIAGCDKSLPGMLMATARLDLPSIFLYGGTIMPGRYKGKDVTIQDAFEAAGKYRSRRYNRRRAPCGGMRGVPRRGGVRRANTPPTQWLASLRSPWTGPCLDPPAPPAESPERFEMLSDLGPALLKNFKRGICCRRKSLPWQAFENAIAIGGAATGGSTNIALHLPAIAHELGIELTLDDIDRVSRRTPTLADLRPGGRYVMLDLFEAGGVPVVLKALLDAGALHGDAIAVNGKTMAENLKGVKIPTNQDVVVPLEKPSIQPAA